MTPADDWAASGGLFTTPFDPDDPMNTPRGLNVANPRVADALLQAVRDLTSARIPLDAPLGSYQYVDKAGVRIPMPGGPPAEGQYNLVVADSGWVPGRGYPNVNIGSSFVMWVQFTDSGPVGRSITSYGQTNDRSSPHSTDQPRLFAEGRSKKMLFRESEIAADPNLVVLQLCGAADGAPLAGGCPRK
jgi:acyl-homoserine-lactone acylase